MTRGKSFPRRIVCVRVLLTTSFTNLVAAGLDPAVHADLRLRKSSSANPIKLSFRMDCRIKSGNDDKAKKGGGTLKGA
jgi:hypothetical protein